MTENTDHHQTTSTKYPHLLDIFSLVILCDFDVIASWLQLIFMHFTKGVVLHRECVVQNILYIVVPVTSNAKHMSEIQRHPKVLCIQSSNKTLQKYNGQKSSNTKMH